MHNRYSILSAAVIACALFAVSATAAQGIKDLSLAGVSNRLLTGAVLTVDTGATLVIASGGSIVAQAGSTVTGFGGGSGTGTVTSVALSLPGIFAVSGSPVTGAGTFSVGFVPQAANAFLAGPAGGAAAVPAFRLLVAADVPDLADTLALKAPLASPSFTGNVGLATASPLQRLHIKSNSATLPGLVAGNMSHDYYGLVVESEDAVLGLVSRNEGGHGSGIDLMEVNSGTLADKWWIGRDSSGAGSTLLFSYGTNPDYALLTPLMELSPTGNLTLVAAGTKLKAAKVESTGTATLSTAGTGNVLVGPFAGTALTSSSGVTPTLQVGTNTQSGAVLFQSGVNDATAPAIYAQKSRGGLGVYTTATTSGTGLYFLAAEGADGVSAVRRAASIGIYADGTFSATSAPAYMSFSTTPSASVTPVERLKIGSDGVVLVTGVLKAGSTPVTLTDAAGNILSAALNTVAVANGGTGRTTGTTAYALLATGTTATGAQQTLANGATTEILVGGGAIALPVWTTSTGSGAPVRATSPTLVTPDLGTPASLTLTNATGLPQAGTVGLTTADSPQFTAVNLGHASDTTLARVSAGVVSIEGNNIVTVGSRPVEICVALSDETTAITTGTAKVTIRAPYAFTVTAVRASVNTVSSSGLPTVDINEGGTTILSTKLTIDASEKTSTTAATAAVISDTAIADDAELTFDIDTAGTGAKGLKVWILGTR